MNKLGKTVLFKPDNSIIAALVDSNVKEQYPAIVTCDWGDGCLNLKVIIDGNNPDIWVTSVVKGDNQYEWQELEK